MTTVHCFCLSLVLFVLGIVLYSSVIWGLPFLLLKRHKQLNCNYHITYSGSEILALDILECRQLQKHHYSVYLVFSFRLPSHSPITMFSIHVEFQNCEHSFVYGGYHKAFVYTGLKTLQVSVAAITAVTGRGVCFSNSDRQTRKG